MFHIGTLLLLPLMACQPNQGGLVVADTGEGLDPAAHHTGEAEGASIAWSRDGRDPARFGQTLAARAWSSGTWSALSEAIYD